MIKRIFVEDGWNLAHAIKQREENSLLDRFQMYWKERCDNENFLSIPHVLSILMQFAIDNFKREDWFQYKEYFRLHRLVENNETIKVIELINAYLVSIDLMKMYYE
jgi:uncharacterized protein YqcC (DUF446 family)